MSHITLVQFGNKDWTRGKIILEELNWALNELIHDPDQSPFNIRFVICNFA
jgi:hypothetical protein